MERVHNKPDGQNFQFKYSEMKFLTVLSANKISWRRNLSRAGKHSDKGENRKSTQQARRTKLSASYWPALPVEPHHNHLETGNQIFLFSLLHMSNNWEAWIKDKALRCWPPASWRPVTWTRNQSCRVLAKLTPKISAFPFSEQSTTLGF